MKAWHRPRVLATLAASALVLGLALVVAPATAAAPNDSGGGGIGDIRHADVDNKKAQLDAAASVTRQFPGSGARGIGDTVPWLGLDDYQGSYYLKDYVLRGKGDKIEVWVAKDRAFPTARDCRNQLDLTDVTDAQVRNFIAEFDGNIFPKESNVFSVAPPRNGSDAILPEIIGLPQDTYVGPADNTVVLVDNVRDTNYYDPRDPNGRTYIAGFFSSQLNEYFDRNVMTIDAFDWLHRTGANPPDDSADPAYQACANYLLRPGLGAADPFRYEGIFAHEYQHLLMNYEDADETNWINEGLADWATALVGYEDPARLPNSPKIDSHLKCFMGYYPDPLFGGPENSLTNWGDQGAPEILCDYGAAWAIMQYLSSHYGVDFMTFLHRDDRNGLVSLDAALDQEGTQRDARELLHDWAAAMAVDWQIDKNSGVGNGQYQASSLSARINWANPQSYSSPGAPANGSDYVRLRGTGGNYLGGGDISRISFEGARTLEPDPLGWSVDRTPPPTVTDQNSCGSPPANGTGAAALYSGCGDNLDRAAVREVTVPASGGTLTFDALWNTEVGWDYGYVQVSTDGGRTYKSLATGSTTADHDPGAIAAVVANLPGFTGTSDGWVGQRASLSAYAGRTVLLAFRYISDPSVTGAGMWVRNVKVGPTRVPTNTVNGWQSATQVLPVPVAGFTVQLVSYNAGGGVVKVARMPLDASFSGTIYSSGIERFVDPNADVVAALVMYDEPTELVFKQARYTLQVNQAVQPGG